MLITIFNRPLFKTDVRVTSLIVELLFTLWVYTLKQLNKFHVVHSETSGDTDDAHTLAHNCTGM